MNTQRARWSRHYQTALRRHLASGSRANPQLARSFGREAVALGLQTLDVAKSYEQALTAVLKPGDSPRGRQRAIRLAEAFFTETIVPMETHSAALKADISVHKLTRTLNRRTLESSLATRRLKRSIIQRQGAETSLRKSGQQHATLLAESHRLQKHLRHLTYTILSAQEDERKKNSREIHDEIAQTLIAIDLRLLTLKNAAKASTASLKKEIANTQRLVRKSTTKLHRLIRL